MSNIKKQFVELVEFLELNKDKKVNTILEDIIKMSSSKVAQQATVFNEDGSPFAIYCYYHKQWEEVASVEYGSKASSKSGLNTMCKVGVSAWTKQQADATKAKDVLIQGVSTGVVDPMTLKDALAEIEANRVSIHMEQAPIGSQVMPEGLSSDALLADEDSTKSEVE